MILYFYIILERLERPKMKVTESRPKKVGWLETCPGDLETSWRPKPPGLQDRNV
jgi:hypothetical protein